MSGIFGLNFNPTAMIATIAMGPAGGLAAQLTSQLYASMGQQIINQLGQQFGLSQSALSLVNNAFQAGAGGNLGALTGFGAGQIPSLAETVENVGNQLGASPQEIGEQQRVAENFVNDIVRQAREQAEESDTGAVRGGKGQGWLMAMAKALGAQLDQLGAKMENMASRITKDTPGLSSQFSVVTQQFSMLMNAASNGIKTVGESMGNMARKN